MGNSVQRRTDQNMAGGVITSTSVTLIRANGLAVATDGDTVSADSNCSNGNIHCAPITANGAGTVRANGEPINRTQDPDSCGDPRKENGVKIRITTT